MESRTFEGPMDWEYQDRGPLDPTSPFAQAAHNASRNTSTHAIPSRAPAVQAVDAMLGTTD